MLIPGLMNGALSKPSAKVLLLYDIRKERACTNTHTQSADIQQKENFEAYTNAKSACRQQAFLGRNRQGMEVMSQISRGRVQFLSNSLLVGTNTLRRIVHPLCNLRQSGIRIEQVVGTKDYLLLAQSIHLL